MRFYETMFVVKPTLTQEEIVQKIDFYKTAILNNGGEISATLDMGMRNLAYEIKKTSLVIILLFISRLNQSLFWS